MNILPRIAIFGLYNSCSTALAGALHRLGVHMGGPFWYSSDEHAPNNFYEPWDLERRRSFIELDGELLRSLPIFIPGQGDDKVSPMGGGSFARSR